MLRRRTFCAFIDSSQCGFNNTKVTNPIWYFSWKFIKFLGPVIFSVVAFNIAKNVQPHMEQVERGCDIIASSYNIFTWVFHFPDFVTKHLHHTIYFLFQLLVCDFELYFENANYYIELNKTNQFYSIEYNNLRFMHTTRMFIILYFKTVISIIYFRWNESRYTLSNSLMISLLSLARHVPRPTLFINYSRKPWWVQSFCN